MISGLNCSNMGFCEMFSKAINCSHEGICNVIYMYNKATLNRPKTEEKFIKIKLLPYAWHKLFAIPHAHCERVIAAYMPASNTI